MSPEKKLSDLMDESKFVCLSPETTVILASRKMLECHIGAVIVYDKNKTVGIVTERDINYRVVAAQRDPSTTLLSDIMTKNPKTMPPETKVTVALKIMAKNGYRHIPVEVDGNVVGIVSITDVFTESKKKLGGDIKDIEDFILGDAFLGSETSH